MSQTPRSLLLLVLRKLLARGRGEARALEQALHLLDTLRYFGLFGLTILGPSLLLAYFGVSSIRADELEVMAEVGRDAELRATTFSAEVEAGFTSFERAVGNRLGAGRSPVERPGELHPHLLAALRFDGGGRLLAPFVEESSFDEEIAGIFQPAMEAAVSAETQGDEPLQVARLYGNAAREAVTPAWSARARFDRGRMLARAGRDDEARRLFAQVALMSGGMRDTWGMRLTDLARLESAELLLNQDPSTGATALRGLVDDLLARRWTIGQGGEGAIARRALSLLQSTDDPEWTSQARDRVAERTELLYWSTQLLPELDKLVGRTLRSRPGEFQWRQGERALWATTWWDGDLYAFGLDLQTVVSEIKADARGIAPPDANIVAYVVSPSEPLTDDFLERRSLAPWLTGWATVVAAKDPEALVAQQVRRRTLRVVVIFTSVFSLSFGALLLVRLLKRELDVAHLKTDFAANVSHELRSPITQIRLKGEALMLGLADTEEERDNAYAAIVRESERLSRLVDNVLDFSAIERGAKRYTLRPADIFDTTMKAVDSISSAQELQDKDLAVDLPFDLPQVDHDPDAIAQCLINLVSNAAKYSAPNGRIAILGRLVEDPQLGPSVDIAVSDDGIGIPPHDLRRIFEPFFRSNDSLARRRKGTGIGLTITKYIMDAHGGQILVQSRPGQGSTFTLRFPLKKRPPNSAPHGA